MPIRSVCVFLGSAPGRGPGPAELAAAVGAAIAGRGWTLVYGGASVGLMGVLADAALAAGGTVIGVIPASMVEREIAHPGVSIEVVASMAERKQRMFAQADAFLTLPGGYGTLDELFEALTAAQLGHHRKPCVVVDEGGYYRPLVEFLDGAVAAGLLRPHHRALLTVKSKYQDALSHLGDLP